MPPVGPLKTLDFIRYLRQLGWEGPYPGGKHLLMYHGTARLTIPNPHRGDLSRDLVLRLLRQAGIDRATWEPL
jgi:predicted RNA binding protein YcfA (HicA-like mRNA interferase family)